MKKFGAHHVYMDDLAGATGGGGAGDPGAAAGADAAAGAGATQPGGASGAGTGAGDGSNPTGSALSAGGATDWSIESVPEKYRVKGDDGELDVQATLRKVDEGRSALEKRLGDGSARPKSADEYKLPDTEAFKAIEIDDAAAKAFKDKAHSWGLSQSQYENVMSEWATLAPGLVNAGQAETVDSAVAALKETWKGDYDANLKGSFRAVTKLAETAGIPYDEVEKAIGNNPIAIRLFAALAPEMREDTAPASAAGATGGGAQTYSQYIAENYEAYSDPKNPKHAAVTARARTLSERENKGSQPL